MTTQKNQSVSESSEENGDNISVVQLQQASQPVARTQSFDLSPQSFEQAQQFAEMIAHSDLVPRDYQGKPGNCLVAMQMGNELGVPPLQAIQNIAVINGRPAIWGDLVLALVKAHPHYEYINESFDEQTWVASCTLKRKNEPEQTRHFSREDALTAGIWDKNVHKTFPKRMLQMRARGFCARDVFPDAMKGLAVAEEIIDLEKKDYSNVNKPASTTSAIEGLITSEQEQEISKIITTNGFDLTQCLAYFKVSSLSELRADLYEKAVSVLIQRVNENGGTQ